MSKKFTENERELIRQKLKDAAMDCLQLYGLRKTSVDELVQRATISKGAFYSFYASKELLFFDVLLDFHETVEQLSMERLAQLPQPITANSLADFLSELFHVAEGTVFLKLMQTGELELLMRKLPDEVVREHQAHDVDFSTRMAQLLPNQSEEQSALFAAGMRGLFLLLMHRREVGSELFPEVLHKLILGFCKQFID